MIVYEGGSVRALRNSGNLNRNANRRNWHDLGTIAPGVAGTTGDMIRFADMTGDGLADFLQIQDDGSIRRWSNEGLVGADVDDLRFADLTGDGKADMIYVDPVGRARAWLNSGLGVWRDVGAIATMRADEDLSDSRILFADVNGDGLADYLVVYGGGAVRAWLNNGAIVKHADGDQSARIWGDPMVIATGVAGNSDGGKVRFADLNGDGFDDYLVLWDGGAVDAYLNQQQIPPNGRPIWRAKETVATGVGELGSKIRFVQLNKDGKAEYMVQYDGGAAKAYLNTGDIPGSSKILNWIDVGTVAAGVSEPGPVFYADIDGDGKDDYLVRYADGSVSAWLNTCDWIVKETPGHGGDDGGDDEDGPYKPNPDDDELFPTCPYTVTTIDELISLDYNNDLPSWCVPRYMMPVLLATLEDLNEQYEGLLDDDYDHYFDVYADHIVSDSREVLNDFMLNHGDEYFTCKIWQRYACCTGCEANGFDCEGCLDPCEIESGYDDGIRFRLRDQPCPPDYSQRNNLGYHDSQSIIWSFKDDKTEEEFWGAVAAEVGAPQKRFEIEDHGYIFADDDTDYDMYCDKQFIEGGWDNMDEFCQHKHFWSYAPNMNGFVASDVFNPKDNVKEALKSIKDVIGAVGELSLAVEADEYYNNANDLVDALALPVFMLQSAVESMKSVLDMGKEIEEEEMKEFIINLISSLLVVATMGGGALVEAGFITLGKWLVRAAESGSAALGLVSVVENPDSAPLVVFGLIMSARGVYDVEKVAKAATLRRSMTYKDISALNKEVAGLLEKEKNVNRRVESGEACRWA